MKKHVSILLCLLICLSLVACNSNRSAPVSQNEEARAALTKVLNKEQSFSYTCMVRGETTEETLEKFTFNLPYQALYAFVPQYYVFEDRDSDGVEELLILDMRLFCILVLRYQEGTVHGTILDNIDLDNYQTLDWVNME